MNTSQRDTCSYLQCFIHVDVIVLSPSSPSLTKPWSQSQRKGFTEEWELMLVWRPPGQNSLSSRGETNTRLPPHQTQHTQAAVRERMQQRNMVSTFTCKGSDKFHWISLRCIFNHINLELPLLWSCSPCSLCTMYTYCICVLVFYPSDNLRRAFQTNNHINYSIDFVCVSGTPPKGKACRSFVRLTVLKQETLKKAKAMAENAVKVC